MKQSGPEPPLKNFGLPSLKTVPVGQNIKAVCCLEVRVVRFEGVFPEFEVFQIDTGAPSDAG